MVAGITTVYAMIAVGVVEHIELLVSLHECLSKLHAIANVHIIIGHTMHEQQASIEVASTADGRGSNRTFAPPHS